MLVLAAPRRDRRPGGARGRRHRRSDARRDRGADRVRDEGRVHPAALLAAARAPRRARAAVGADVGDDDQGRALRADPRRVPVARRDAAVARDRAARRSGCRPRSAACCGRSCSTTSSACSRTTRSRTSGSSRSASAPRCCSPTPATGPGRRSRSRRRCCTSPTTRSSSRCCSSAPARFERAVGSLDLDHLGGLLRRMPWTGGAFLIGCDGDRRPAAAERLRVGVADAAVAAARRASSAGRRRARRRALALAGARGDGGARAAVLRQGRRARAARRAAARRVRGGGRPARRDARRRWSSSRRSASCSASSPASCCRRSRGSPRAPPARAAPATLGLIAARHRLLPDARARARARRSSPASLVRLRGTRRAAPAPTWACGQPVVPALGWTSAAFTKPLRLVLESCCGPQRTIEVVRERRDGPGGHLLRPRALARRHARSTSRRSAPGCAPRGVARRLQTGNVRTYAAYLLGLVLALLALARTGVPAG